MFDNIFKFFKKFGKKDIEELSSKEMAKERLHLVLMQDRANVSADFLDMMKQEIIEVIKKYIDVDEKDIDVRLTNKVNDDGTTGAPALYANIPIAGIKQDLKVASEDVSNTEKKEPTEKDIGNKEKKESDSKEPKNKEKVKENKKEDNKDDKDDKADKGTSDIENSTQSELNNEAEESKENDDSAQKEENSKTEKSDNDEQENKKIENKKDAKLGKEKNETKTSKNPKS